MNITNSATPSTGIALYIDALNPPTDLCPESSSICLFFAYY